MKKKFTFLRLKRFRTKGSREKKLFFEAFIYLCIIRVKVIFLPFKKLAGRMGEHMQESPSTSINEQQGAINKISIAIAKAARYTPCRSLCMEQALVANIMLKKRELSSTIYFGVQKKENLLKAHAWTRSGNIIVTGARGRRKFEIISYFGRH